MAIAIKSPKSAAHFALRLVMQKAGKRGSFHALQALFGK
jgi:hypothetical protein